MACYSWPVTFNLTHLPLWHLKLLYMNHLISVRFSFVADKNPCSWNASSTLLVWYILHVFAQYQLKSVQRCSLSLYHITVWYMLAHCRTCWPSSRSRASGCDISQSETTCGNMVIITDEAITVSGQGGRREVEGEGGGRYSLNVCIASWTSSIKWNLTIKPFFQTETVFLIIN